MFRLPLAQLSHHSAWKVRPLRRSNGLTSTCNPLLMSPEARSTLLQVGPFAVALLMLTVAISGGRIPRQDIGLHPPTKSGSWRWIMGFLLYSLAVEAGQYAYAGHWPVLPWTYALPVLVVRAGGILLVAPLVEELLLRGVLLAVLRRRHVPVLVAIGLQSAVFTLLHIGALSASWAGVLGVGQILVDGILFGAARYQTGSLYPAIAMHILGNSIAVAERALPR